MKTSQADILIVPGYKGSGKNHWQTRWENNLKTARRVQMGDWHKPVFEDWRQNLINAVIATDKPVVIVGHSIGAQIIAHASHEFEGKVAGAFLVAPPDVENTSTRPRHLLTFGPYPREPLPFPSFTIASRNDQFCAYEKAEEMAACWGSFLVDAGQSGHIDDTSGHGPWPEGLMVVSKFMSRI
ncbi:MAG: serine hydrolase family protein [Hyphomicrobiales bacterium]|nr:serine hydrolase family protein [Hyphomicrobiales bacterium]